MSSKRRAVLVSKPEITHSPESFRDARCEPSIPRKTSRVQRRRHHRHAQVTNPSYRMVATSTDGLILAVFFQTHGPGGPPVYGGVRIPPVRTGASLNAMMHICSASVADDSIAGIDRPSGLNIFSGVPGITYSSY